MSAARVIRRVRQRMELTQEEFGIRLGLKGPTVSRYESGHIYPSNAVLLLLSTLATPEEMRQINPQPIKPRITLAMRLLERSL